MNNYTPKIGSPWRKGEKKNPRNIQPTKTESERNRKSEQSNYKLMELNHKSRNSQQSPGPDGFTGEFYKHLKK